MKTQTCPICGGIIEQKRINFFEEINGKRIIIEDVPAEVCRQCGEITFTPETVDILLAKVRDGGKAETTVEVPVYHFPRL